MLMITMKYENIYKKFMDKYQEIHVDPWHAISKPEIEVIADKLISNMDIDNDSTFKYFMNYLIKRLSGESDAHTKIQLQNVYPINFRIFDNEVLVNYPTTFKGAKLVAINGVPIIKIMDELDEIITYGTIGKKKYELEKSLFDRVTLFGLPSLCKYQEISYELESLDGEKMCINFKRDEKFDMDKMFSVSKYLYGNVCKYVIQDNVLIYEHSSIQNKFKEQIEDSINRLKDEDLQNVNTFIIDIRGNLGGNATLNSYLIDFIKENSNKKIICLTDYRVFSGGRYALVDLIKLGAITIGEEIGTPINCFGNSHWINIDGYDFSISECYFHPSFDYSASSKEEFKNIPSFLLEPMLFKPDLLVCETKEDYLRGEDIILNQAIKFAKDCSFNLLDNQYEL